MTATPVTLRRRNGDARNTYSYTLRNPYHNTVCTIHVPHVVDNVDELFSEIWHHAQVLRSASAQRCMRRVHRVLCGQQDCTCSAVWELVG